MKNVFIYAVPRSGTNVFAFYLHLHNQIFSVNAQRYFLQASSPRPINEFSVLRNAGIKKPDRTSVTVYDETRPLLFPAFSQSRHLSSLAGRFIREASLRRFLVLPSSELFLYRNPIKIAESMNRFAATFGRAHWRLDSVESLTRFYKYYRKFLERIRRMNTVIVTDPGVILSRREAGLAFFKVLDLGHSLGSYEEAKRNARCGACGAELELCSDKFGDAVGRSCSCGITLEGYGKFDPHRCFDYGRFVSLAGIDLDRHAASLRAVFGERLSQCFLSSEKIDGGFQELKNTFLA